MAESLIAIQMAENANCLHDAKRWLRELDERWDYFMTEDDMDPMSELVGWVRAWLVDHGD